MSLHIIEEALFSLLTDNEVIATLIGNRVYPEGNVPEKATKPYAVHSRVSSPAYARTNDRKTYRVYRLQIDCYADTPLQARLLGDTIDSELDNHKGLVDHFKIEAFFVEDVRGGFDEETNEKIASLDVTIWAKHTL